MSYRSDLDALAARHDALESEAAKVIEQRDAASRLLEEARARARLPILDNIRVATPCRADWNQMTGDDRVRTCAACEKQVFNLSSMTRDEAEALVIDKAGKLCVRYYQRADGTILLADCTIGKSQQRKRRWIAAGAAALLAGGGALAFELSRDDERTESVHAPVAVMGDPAPDQGGYVMGGSASAPPAPVEEVKGDIQIDVAPHRHGKR